MLSASFVISILIQLIIPVVICYLVVRRFKGGWRLCLVGGISYLIFLVAQPMILQLVEGNEFYTTQIAGLPMVWILLAEGLILALVEQAIRTGSYWYVRGDVKAWTQGLTVASGQAALGMLLSGLFLLASFFYWNTLTGTKGEGLNLTPEELTNLAAQLGKFWDSPWYLPQLWALQSIVILTLQLGLGMIVWWALSQKAWVWLAAAVLWETAMNTLFLVLGQREPDWLSAGALVLMAAVHAGFLYWFHRKTGDLAAVPA